MPELAISSAQIFAAIAEQHATLRMRILECELLADEVDRGFASSVTLWDGVRALRQEVDAHNRFEEQSLRMLLREVSTAGDISLERRYLEHLDEHMGINDRLYAGSTVALRAALSGLREHLDTEDRLFGSRSAARKPQAMPHLC